MTSTPERIRTLFMKGKIDEDENNVYTLKIARKPTFINVVEIKALIGGGATECASIVTVCIGKEPHLCAESNYNKYKCNFEIQRIGLVYNIAKEMQMKGWQHLHGHK